MLFTVWKPYVSQSQTASLLPAFKILLPLEDTFLYNHLSVSESKAEEHLHSPFVSLQLQMLLITSNGEIIYRGGSSKLVASGIQCRTSAGNNG